MKNEMKDGKLNIFADPAGVPDPSVPVMDTSHEPTEDEIRAVEEMYLATLDAEVPDIWSRIEAGVNAEKSAAESEQKKNIVSGDDEKGSRSDEKVISLADRKRKKKAWFAVIGAAAAVLIVLIPATMFGGTRNSKKSSKSDSRDRKAVSFTVENEETDSLAGNMLNADQDKMDLKIPDYAGGVEFGDDSVKEEATQSDENTSYGAESTTQGSSYSRQEKYQISSEGYVYLEDGKIIFETLTDSKYEIFNADIFGQDDFWIISNGGRISVTLKGDFVDGNESSRTIIIYEYE